MKIRILFLSSRLPYPPIGGDRLKNYWLLKILSKYFNVHLVSITEDDIPEDFYSFADSLGITYKIFKKPKWKFYLNSLKSFTNNLPLQVNYYYFKDIQEYINQIYEDYNLIFANLIRTAKYVMRLNKPKIIDIADSIGQNYLRSYKRTSSLFWKLIYKFEAERLLKFEEKCIDSFDKSLFFNIEEMKFFNKPEKTIWIPHGVNESLLNYNKMDRKYRNCITFFGKMDVQHNIDAVLWFVKNVFLKINKSIKLIIVGANPTREVKKLETKYKNIKVTGYVEDPYLIIKSSLCSIAPLQTGGGIQNKILESMALGTINIISSLAAKPIRGKNKVHYFVEDDPDRIANLINDIYKNPQKYDYIKSNAREYIKNNFTWSIYERKLLRVINSVLDSFGGKSL